MDVNSPTTTPALPDVLTTGQAAKVCSVGIKTVIRWVDRGVLVGWHVPGTTHRRIERTVLEKFAADHGMPINWSLLPKRKTKSQESP